VTGAEAEELDETGDTTEADAACESLVMDSPKSNPIIEERPVAGGGKTFEQLLEEELSEDQRQQTSSKSQITPKLFRKSFPVFQGSISKVLKLVTKPRALLLVAAPRQ